MNDGKTHQFVLRDNDELLRDESLEVVGRVYVAGDVELLYESMFVLLRYVVGVVELLCEVEGGTLVEGMLSLLLLLVVLCEPSELLCVAVVAEVRLLVLFDVSRTGVVL